MEIESFKKVNMKDGDVLLCELEIQASSERVALIADHLKDIFPLHKCIIFRKGEANFTIISNADIKKI